MGMIQQKQSRKEKLHRLRAKRDSKRILDVRLGEEPARELIDNRYQVQVWATTHREHEYVIRFEDERDLEYTSAPDLRIVEQLVKEWLSEGISADERNRPEVRIDELNIEVELREEYKRNF